VGHPVVAAPVGISCFQFQELLLLYFLESVEVVLFYIVLLVFRENYVSEIWAVSVD